MREIFVPALESQERSDPRPPDENEIPTRGESVALAGEHCSRAFSDAARFGVKGGGAHGWRWAEWTPMRR